MRWRARKFPYFHPAALLELTRFATTRASLTHLTLSEGGVAHLLKKARKWTYKPGSVLRVACAGHEVTVISLGCRLLDTSSGLPGSHDGPDQSVTVPVKAPPTPCLALLRVGFA